MLRGFCYAEDQNSSGVLILLKPETVEEILAETARVWMQVGRLFDRPGLRHDQGIQLFRTGLAKGGPLFVEIVRNRVIPVIPERWHKYVATDEQLDSELEKVSTHKKWRTILENADVSSDNLNDLIKTIRAALPKTKKDLLVSIRRLPGEAVGKKSKLSPAQKQEICDSIRKRFAPRVNLKDLYESLAPDYGVDAITIKRVWLRYGAKKKQSG